MDIRNDFKEHADKKVIEELLADIDNIVETRHVDNEDDLVDNDFDFLTTLELEGYWLLPDGTFDFGNTNSYGTPLYDVSPLDTKQGFKTSLTKALNNILKEL